MLESHISEADEAYFRLFTTKVTMWAELLFPIRQVPGSNLDPESGLSWLKFFRDCPQQARIYARARAQGGKFSGAAY